MRMVQKGIPFKTLGRLPENVRADMNFSYLRPNQTYGNGHSIGLGICAAGFQPSIGDLKQYELMKMRVATQPHGRGGLKMGGIVWRLLVDILHPDGEYAPSESGSYEVLRDGKAVYFDNILSPHEQDIICGVYRVPMGMY